MISNLSGQIGEHLRERRKEVFPGDTQQDMAARLGIGVATYSRMERGDMRVSFRHFLEAGRILQCEGSFLRLYTEPDRRPGLIQSLLKERGSSVNKP